MGIRFTTGVPVPRLTAAFALDDIRRRVIEKRMGIRFGIRFTTGVPVPRLAPAFALNDL